MGLELKFNSTYHPDSQSEKIIETLEDILRICMLDFGASWEDHIHLIEFTYNNYQSKMKMTSFEALYERKCRSSIIYQDDIG